MIVLESLS